MDSVRALPKGTPRMWYTSCISALAKAHCWTLALAALEQAKPADLMCASEKHFMNDDVPLLMDW